MRQDTVKIKLFAQMTIGVTDECQILMYSIIEHAAQPHSNSDDMLKRYRPNIDYLGKTGND